jgi:hypothetical protein
MDTVQERLVNRAKAVGMDWYILVFSSTNFWVTALEMLRPAQREEGIECTGKEKCFSSMATLH